VSETITCQKCHSIHTKRLVDQMQDYVKKFEGKLLVHCAFCFFKDIGFDQKKFMQGFNKPDPQTSEGMRDEKEDG
jgi:hypothetical protein